jgi:hypothetical protein
MSAEVRGTSSVQCQSEQSMMVHRAEEDATGVDGEDGRCRRCDFVEHCGVSPQRANDCFIAIKLVNTSPGQIGRVPDPRERASRVPSRSSARRPAAMMPGTMCHRRLGNDMPGLDLVPSTLQRRSIPIAPKGGAVTRQIDERVHRLFDMFNGASASITSSGTTR